MTLLFAPIAVAWIAAAALMVLDGRRRWVARLAAGLLAAVLAAHVLLAVEVLRHGPVDVVAGGWPAGVGIRLRADALGVAFAMISTGVLLAALVHEALAGIVSRVFPALVLFMAAGLSGLFLTYDVFSFYVFFELAMISAYSLSAYGDDPAQAGGALIFAVVNLLGSFVFLLGVAGLYHLTGTLEMSAVAERLAASPSGAAVVIAVVIFVAFSVKLGLLPFHFWLPAVYIGARPAVAAILSGALANIGSYGILRFGAGVFPEQLELGAPLVIALGAASIVYGAVQAVSRRDSSEVLAYSAIGQVGYVLIAVGVGGPVGYAAAVLYALLNALNKALLFLSTQLRGWLVGAVFAVGAFSVVGVPPAAGFLGKAALFQTGVEEGSALIVALVFLGGALSFVYMFQVYQNDFWAFERTGEASPARARAVVFGLALLVLALGLWPEPLLALSRDAAGVLMERA